MLAPCPWLLRYLKQPKYIWQILLRVYLKYFESQSLNPAHAGGKYA